MFWGNGQISPSDWKRAIVARTVDDAKPVRRATSRLETPANVKRRTSRTTRIATLSAGIDPLLGKAKERTLHTASRGLRNPALPGDIIPEWWARINRNAGRQLIGTGGRHHPGISGRLAPESALLASVTEPRSMTMQDQMNAVPAPKRVPW